MNIQKGKVIELDNNMEYYIIDMLEHKKSTYLYVCSLSLEVERDVKFVEYKNNQMLPVKDANLTENLFAMARRRLQ